MLPPLLEEIGVPLGLMEDFIDRVVRVSDVLALGWLAQSGTRGGEVEPVNGGKLKEALSIGLSPAQMPNQLWQSGGDHGDGGLTLAEPVESEDQSGQLLFGDILKFVEGQDNRRIPLERGPTDGVEKVGEIGLQFTTVGHSPVGLEIEADFDVPILELAGVDEAPERPEGGSQGGASSFATAQAEQGCAQRRCKQPWQRSILRRFNLDRSKASRLGLKTNLIQEDGLADTTEPVKYEAAGGTASLDAIEGDARALHNVITAGKLGRRETSPGRVRVGSRVHL